MDLSALTDHAIIFYQTSEVVHPVELKRHCGDTQVNLTSEVVQSVELINATGDTQVNNRI